MTDADRILIIRYGALGDILLTTPLIAELRRQLPEHPIDLLVRPHFRALVENNPDIDRIIELPEDRALLSLRRSFRGRYRYGIDLQNKAKSRLAIALARPQNVVRLVRRSAGQLFRELYRGPEPVTRTEAWRYMGVLAKLGLSMPDRSELQLVFEPGQAARESAGSLGEQPVGLVLNASQPTKRWPIPRFIELARRLRQRGLDPVVLAGPPDRHQLRPYLSELKDVAHLPSLHLGLKQIGGIIAGCELVVGVDSGLLHMAAALNKPVVALFGPTDYRRWRPNGVPHRIAHLGLDCSPCRSHGSKSCPLGHHDCINNLAVDQVIAALEGLQERIVGPG